LRNDAAVSRGQKEGIFLFKGKMIGGQEKSTGGL